MGKSGQELVKNSSFVNLQKSNAIHIDAITRLLIEKGVFTKEEFLVVQKQLEIALEK